MAAMPKPITAGPNQMVSFFTLMFEHPNALDTSPRLAYNSAALKKAHFA
ncbi:MAG: hypothetical protein ACK40V_09925 [Anaerolineales bacterium]